MRDRYPPYPTIPAGFLVPEEQQPEYLALPGRELSDDANLAVEISRAGRAEHVALIHDELDRELTFGELERESGLLASALHDLGLRPGDRVAFRCSNRPEVVIVALAAWRLGAIVVPIPLQARASELRFYLEDTGARVLFCSEGDGLAPVSDAIGGTLVERVVVIGGDHGPYEPWEELLAAPASFDGPIPSADSVAIIWHTGGTTGVPKACYHTQRRFLLAGYACADAIGTDPGRRWIAAAPVGHGLGFLCHTTYTLLHGASAVMIEGFQQPDRLLAAIERHRATTFMGLAVTWARMLDVLDAGADHDLSSLETGYAMWQSASSTQVRDGWQARGIELLNNFGSTAFATWVLVPRQGDERIPPASLGQAAPGYVVTAVDPEAGEPRPVPAETPGRMAVKGPSGLTYWNRPDLQARDVANGWNLVDDLIRLDAEGYAEYLGRTDYVISTAGFKVAPVEVEEVLARHPAVSEVAVIGLPDPLRQEVVAAFVVLRDPSGASDELKAELQSHAKRELAPYKYPRHVEFIPQLPRDAVGKVQPRLLLERSS